MNTDSRLYEGVTKSLTYFNSLHNNYYWQVQDHCFWPNLLCFLPLKMLRCCCHEISPWRGREGGQGWWGRYKFSNYLRIFDVIMCVMRGLWHCSLHYQRSGPIMPHYRCQTLLIHDSHDREGVTRLPTVGLFGCDILFNLWDKTYFY